MRKEKPYFSYTYASWSATNNYRILHMVVLHEKFGLVPGRQPNCDYPFPFFEFDILKIDECC